ncbi:MAG: hypothetical protein N3F07_01850 [Candidatus Micrarchaeota archaeon]|nr:hypothetical protein [Candidatus Micrarchaeota archaeon]
MDELTFLDLAILKKIDAESSVEKFGSIINTSFFETANLLGTIKIKGYINIESSVGGISRVMLTDAGSSILQVAEQKSKEPMEPLDYAILHALASGAKDPESIQKSLNVRNADLAYHLNKLIVQGFMDYEIRAAKANFVLTEHGFNITGAVRVQKPPAQPKQPITLADFVEKEAQDKESAGSFPQQAQHSQQPSAPPWAGLPGLDKEGQKEEAQHIAQEAKKDDGRKEKESAKQEEKHKKGHRQPSPEEAKRAELWRRRLSKLEYYVLEYAPYFLLFLVVLGIFLGAIYLSLSKIA